MQFDYDPLTFPGPAMPLSCYRALHSHVIDATLEMSESQRHALVDVCQGYPTFDRFMLTAFRHAITVDIIVEESTGVPWLWVHFAKNHHAEAWPICAVDHRHIGADPHALVLELDIRVQASLDAIVWQEPQP